MPNISQWEMDRLKEHEGKMYQHLNEHMNLVNALVPFILMVLEEQAVKEKIIEIMQENAFIIDTR